MRRIVVFILLFLLILTGVGQCSKLLFLLFHYSLLGNPSFAECTQILFHGLRLDIAVAGYLTLLPGLMLIISLWYHGVAWRWLWKGYFVVASFLYFLAIAANTGLYSYWGFPLDNTPLLYISTSPADAMASVTWWQTLLALAFIAMGITAMWFVSGSLQKYLLNKETASVGRRSIESIILLLLTVALILPIRGGVDTGTNHTGSVYFSSNVRINHAAVNPVFSFVEAVNHQEDIGSKYRFMKDGDASALMRTMTATASRSDCGDGMTKKNVILISLESFSDSIMHIPGVTPNLNRIAAEGIYFRNFYANSFRTDRALVSIHSALPAPTTMSVMDMPRKSTSLPSIAGTLRKHGYSTTFYYGGDINYSNMKSYFMGTGFESIVCDVDFPKHLHTGKWGVADGPVFDRLLLDIRQSKPGLPFYRSIMTASSHEPFDVPAYNRIKSSLPLNAFAYADDCLGRFISELKKLPCWQNTIVVIVPDHLGAYPVEIDNYQLWRYHVPMIITGGGIGPKIMDTYGSQIDIAATVLGMLGFDHSAFRYSKDLLDDKAPHFAFFTFPDAMGIISENGSIIYDNTLDKVHSHTGTSADSLVLKAKAYLQKLYDDLAER